jgi:hypothetical protein
MSSASATGVPMTILRSVEMRVVMIVLRWSRIVAMACRSQSRCSRLRRSSPVPQVSVDPEAKASFILSYGIPSALES